MSYGKINQLNEALNSLAASLGACELKQHYIVVAEMMRISEVIRESAKSPNKDE